ncbi:MAG: phage holin, LLH family [Bacillota bacterium]|nr:phage holin, LLH family [Bacillota bacterium]
MPNDILTYILDKVLEAIIAVVVGGGFLIVRQNVNLQRAVSYAGQVVWAVEQLAKLNGWNSTQKKKEAEARFSAWLAAHHIKLSPEEIDTLLEAAVADLNQTLIELGLKQAPALVAHTQGGQAQA